jgi:queuosine precursor transporter
MLSARYFIAYSLFMTAIVVASNFLVQFPLEGTLAGINLADLLTFGAFTYPIAFLVTDLTNRQFGPTAARKVVFVGFIAGVILSVLLATPRIAVASGSAFLVGQLLDITVFNRLRRQSWWKAPLMGSVIGSVLDTVIFFSLSFAPVFGFIGPNDDFAIAAAPILGVMSAEAPRWISWAIADFSVKMLIGVVMLLPYGALMSVLRPMPQTVRTA